VTGAEERAIDIRDRAMRLAIQRWSTASALPALHAVINDARRIERYLEAGE
jgi:hypothetical protein